MVPSKPSGAAGAERGDAASPERDASVISTLWALMADPQEQENLDRERGALLLPTPGTLCPAATRGTGISLGIWVFLRLGSQLHAEVILETNRIRSWHIKCRNMRVVCLGII